ncbi:hypothetical protein D3C85_1260420 [compost metagenome]
MQGVRTALLRNFLKHGRERCQPGTSGQQQQWPVDFPQIETAQRTCQRHAVTRLGQSSKEAAHQSAGHVADQKADLTILLQ